VADGNRSSRYTLDAHGRQVRECNGHPQPRRAPRRRRSARQLSHNKETVRRRAGVRVSLPGCREPSELLPTMAVVTRDGPHPPAEPGRRRRQARASSFVPAVPPTCHKQRSSPVRSGQPRSLRGGRWAGRTSLTWGWGGGRNCMACKGSQVQSPSVSPRQQRRASCAVCREDRPMWRSHQSWKWGLRRRGA
jgi:hypothetical protein